jgi:hypothetical protein
VEAARKIILKEGCPLALAPSLFGTIKKPVVIFSSPYVPQILTLDSRKKEV